MKVDKRSEEYLWRIKNEMIHLFSWGEEEAYGRINRFWKNKTFQGDELMLYHEDETYWAKMIYFGKGSHWWLREGETIDPVSYP